MLNIIPISGFEDRKNRLLNHKGVYIVPDIKSKQQFQNFILTQKKEVLNADSILRPVDFFQEILHTTHPDFSVISSSVLSFLFKAHQRPFASPHFILKALRSYLPILIHPEGFESYSQWIEKFPPYVKKQKKNLLEQVQSFFKTLKDLKMIEAGCIKYLLVDADLSFWRSPIVVDLGFSLDSTEAELFYQLSRHQEVTVLEPVLFENKIYPQSHKIYDFLREKSKTPVKKSAPALKKSPQKTYQFQTMLGEVRFVTAQLRKSLDQGLKPSELAVIAPSIETYWPCLKSYLLKEGIPFEKSHRTSFLSFPQIQKWTALMQFYSNNVSFLNLENVLLAEKNIFNYSQIKNKYYHCDQSKDLKNLSLKHKINKNIQQTSDEFFKWILDLWQAVIRQHPSPDLNKELMSALSRLAGSFLKLKDSTFSQKHWIEMLEDFLCQKELALSKEETSEGVSCISLNAVTGLMAKKVFFIGMDHSACQKVNPSLFSDKEAHQILTDLGFYCFPQDPYIQEYEVFHFLHSFKGEVSLSMSQTDFNACHLQPSKLWLIAGQKSIEKPQPTVWESIQQLDSLEKILSHLTPEKINDISKSLSHFVSPVSIEGGLSLSPSKIKQFITCPFIFLSQHIFHLQDDHLTDMDLHPMDSGQLAHELLEKMIKNNISSTKDIAPLIESMKENLPVMEEGAWSYYSEWLFQTARRFLEYENRVKSLLPQIKTKGTEVQFKGYWNLSKKCLDQTGEFLIQGRVDRVHILDNELLIIDYKKSLSGERIISSWAKNMPDCQMPFYAQAMESETLSVSGALYLSYKNFKSKGFILKNSKFSKWPHASTRSLCEKEKKEDILKQVNEMIHQAVLNLKSGLFPPQPLNKDTCERCHWNAICRAKHLN